jgi:hypothetical protein
MNNDIITEFSILGGALTLFIGVIICVTRRHIIDQNARENERRKRAEQREKLLV